MDLAPGTQFGRYEIAALIGKGGMGEVYRAHDSRLGRSVAIKILSQELIADPDRVKRFEHEARMLAALNHPHIATIHGVEDALGISALVMELVDGETLAEQVARGPLPIATALEVAGQIADALDAAHEKGIVHRDLKPANVKITSTGAVKVLDFGIAKIAAGSAGHSAGVATTNRETLPGVLLGTAAYMSPEQVRGHATDKRTDIWAFGCVLFELLTGRAAFSRSTVTDTIAAILEREPDWTALPLDAPDGVQRVLRKCLEKEPRRRLRDLGDWNLAIEPVHSGQSAGIGAGKALPTNRLKWVAWAALVACVGMGGFLLVNSRQNRPAAPAQLTRFDMPAAVTLAESGQFSVSPDGRHLVFAATGDDRVLRLWVKSFDAPEVRPLVGTEAGVAQVIPPMFWSPDSQFIAFYHDGKIMKVSRTGGTIPEIICEVPGTAVGGSWNHRDEIIAGHVGGGLTRCRNRDGASSPVTSTGTSGSGRIDHLLPSFLPDGRHFIYFQAWRGDPSRNGIYLGDLELPPEKQPRERLVATGFGGLFVPGDQADGHVLFVRDGALLALPFDTRRLAAAGEPVAIAKGLGAFRDTAFFAASPTTVVYRGAAPDVQLTWVDRQGKVVARAGDPGPFSRLALSPDSTRAVVVRENRANRFDQDLWVVDLVRNSATRLTSDPLFESAPAWSPDGAEVWYASGAGTGVIQRKPPDGAGAPAVVVHSTFPPAINPATTSLALTGSADGQWLVFTAAASPSSRQDIWILPPGPEARPMPFIEQEFDQIEARISPDGRWIAYVSNESGSNEVFVRPLSPGSAGVPAPGPSVVVSRGGGQNPRWRGDSRELLYRTLTGTIMSASIASGSIGAPSELAHVPGMLADWDVSSNGERFLVAIPTQQSAPQFSVILNWRDCFERAAGC